MQFAGNVSTSDSEDHNGSTAGLLINEKRWRDDKRSRESHRYYLLTIKLYLIKSLFHISNYIKFNVFPTKVRHISEILHKTAYWWIYPEYLLYWLKQYGLDNEIWIICTEWTWLTEGHSLLKTLICQFLFLCTFFIKRKNRATRSCTKRSSTNKMTETKGH